MHCHAAKRAGLFLSNFNNCSELVDLRMMKEMDHQILDNKHILRHIALAVKNLEKQALPFRSHRED